MYKRQERTSILKKLITEINDIVVVFLNYVVTKFGPIAIFVLLSRTFAIYGIHHLKPVSYTHLETDEKEE